MYKDTLTYLALLLAIALAGCSGSDELAGGGSVVGNESALVFSANLNEEYSPTRADLQLAYKHFMVKAVKTDADNDEVLVMPDYYVRYGDTETYGSHWYYDGLKSHTNGDQYLKFWDLTARTYMFAAVSPAPKLVKESFASTDTQVSISNNGEITITDIKGNVSTGNSPNSTDAPDWMIARTIRTMATPKDKEDLDNEHLFPAIQHKQAEVPLNFHHIMSKVDFMAYSTSGYITLSKFNVHIYDDGDGDPSNDDLIINQGNYTTEKDAITGISKGWYECEAVSNSQQDPRRFGEYTYLEGGRVVPEGYENAVLLASHVQIPQEWIATGRLLHIYCETNDNKKFTGVIRLDETTNGTNSWMENKHYTYILKIDTEGTKEVILFGVNMDDWQWQEGNSLEEKQQDW